VTVKLTFENLLLVDHKIALDPGKESLKVHWYWQQEGDRCVLQISVCCSVLQCVAVCCSVLQCVVVSLLTYC